MRQIPLGAKGSFSLLVQPEHLADRFKDAILPPVFATPVMIMVMENAALNAIRAYLDPGESALGTAVDGRQIEFTVRATEGAKEIGAGSHSRTSSTWPNSRGGSNEESLARPDDRSRRRIIRAWTGAEPRGSGRRRRKCWLGSLRSR